MDLSFAFCFRSCNLHNFTLDIREFSNNILVKIGGQILLYTDRSVRTYSSDTVDERRDEFKPECYVIKLGESCGSSYHTIITSNKRLKRPLYRLWV